MAIQPVRSLTYTNATNLMSFYVQDLHIALAYSVISLVDLYYLWNFNAT